MNITLIINGRIQIKLGFLHKMHMTCLAFSLVGKKYWIMEAKNLKFATKIIYKCSYKSHRKYLKLRTTDMGMVWKFEVGLGKFNVENICSLLLGLVEVMVVVVVVVVVAVVAICK